MGMEDPHQEPKCLRFRVVAEYADGSVAKLEVANPVGAVHLDDVTHDDPQEIEYPVGPQISLSTNGYLLRRFALKFVANDATAIVIQTDTPEAEEPGNG